MISPHKDMAKWGRGAAGGDFSTLVLRNRILFRYRRRRSRSNGPEERNFLLLFSFHSIQLEFSLWVCHKTHQWTMAVALSFPSFFLRSLLCPSVLILGDGMEGEGGRRRKKGFSDMHGWTDKGDESDVLGGKWRRRK